MRNITVDDHTLAFRDEGVGDTPLVLLHGFPLDSSMWEPQVRHFAPNCRVLAPDFAGFGNSDVDGGQASPSVDAWADDVIAVLGALGLDHVTLVGASLGADVALAVARRERDLVGALALAGLRPDPASPDEEFRWTEQEQWMANGGDAGAVVDRFADEFVGQTSSRRSEVTKVTRVMMGRASAAGWSAGFKALRDRPAVAPDIDKLDLPTVLLTGADDEIAAPDDARDLAASIPGAGFIEIADAGHLPNLENPPVFNQAIEDLLAGRLSRRPSGKHSWPAAPAGTR